MSIKSRKSPPPIVLILLGLLCIFGWQKFIAVDNQSDSPSTEVSKASQSLANRFSWGNRILISANATEAKRKGITVFNEQYYSEAIAHFQQSLVEFRNDPETVIYLNNARVANQPQVVITAKIAVVVPIGSNLDVAQEMLRGVAQAQTEFNQQGGNLQIQIINDENDPEIAKQVAKTLVKDQSIMAVIGSNTSNASLAAAPIYQEGRLVMMTPTSTAGELSNFGSYIFRTAPTNNDMANALAEYVVKIAKRKNVAVCYDSQAPDNVTFKDDFIPAVTAQGGNSINTECDLAAPDFNAENAVNDLISSGAEAVLLAPHIDRLNRAIDLARANEWKMLLVGTFSLNTDQITQTGQGDLNGIVLPVPFHPDQDSAQNFAAQAEETWGTDTMITWRTATSYDATKAIALGLKTNKTRNGLQQLLRDSNFIIAGANSQVQFLPSGDRLIKPALVKVKAYPEQGYYFEVLSE